MSAVATITARCVACNDWTTDRVGQALADVREMHELICEAGGTVLVEPNGAAPRSPLDRMRAIPDRPIEEEATVEALGQCTKKGCDRAAVERRRVGRYFASYCQAHIDEWRAQKGRARRGKAPEAVPPPAPEPEPTAEPVPVGTTAAPDGSLVELAQRVTDLTERRRSVLAELEQIDGELREAVAACRDALDATALQEVA